MDTYIYHVRNRYCMDHSTHLNIINPQCACAARVTAVVLCVCLFVCLSVYDYSRTTGYEAPYERYLYLALIPIRGSRREGVRHLKAKFDAHFVKHRNVIFERAKFNNRREEQGEPMDAFIMALYGLAEHCGYGELHDEMIRDRIVVRLRDPSLSESLKLDPTLTLEKAVTKVRQAEAIKKQQPLIRSAGGRRVGVKHLWVWYRGNGSGLLEIVNKHRRQPILRLIGSLMSALGVEVAVTQPPTLPCS